MKKLYVMIISLITAISMSVTAYGFNNTVYLSGEEYISSDEIVTVIVELKDKPVLATDESILYGTEYYSSYSGQMQVNSIISTQDEVVSEIEDCLDAPIEPKHTYTAIFNGFAVEIPKSEVNSVKQIENVKNVYITYPYKLHLDTSVGQANSLPVQTVSGDDGYTGEGQVIAIIDNQFEPTHEFFSVPPTNPKYNEAAIQSLVSGTKVLSDHYNSVYISPKVPFAYNYADKTNNGTVLRKSYADIAAIPASHNHGTHVAGIAAGNNRTLKGVAPDAQLLMMRTMFDNGSLSTPAILEAFDDAVILGADVINLSLGSDYLSPQTDFAWGKYLKRAKDLGIAVCASSGNSKFGFSATNSSGNTVSLIPSVEHPDNSASGTPAAFSSATSVASVNNSSSPYTALPPGEISYFSSWGVNESLELKPEISAPGGYINSAYISGYGIMHGTSMASPHMAGVYALMYEYLDRNLSTLTGPARVAEVENMLMSTATIVMQSDNTPYSTRVQGAGLVNTANAINTPVILLGDGDLPKSKISLGELDTTSNEFTLTFNAKNLTETAVTYDQISVKVTTNMANGQVFSSSSKYLTAAITNDLSGGIEIPAPTNENPTEEITLNISLDNDELKENSDIFINGFFIDGFVILATSDSSVPEISIPFTGFYGDWTAAPALDSTMYDEVKSHLYIENASSGTILVSKDNDKTVVCGKTDDGYDKKRIAISPNSDGVTDVIGIATRHLRTITDSSLAITNSLGQKVIATTPLENVYSKYQEVTFTLGDIALRDLPDGNYSFTYEATLYGTEKKESITLPFAIDRQTPEFVDVDLDGNTLTVKATDTHQIDYIKIFSGTSSTPLLSQYIPTNIGAEITQEFTLPDDTDNIKIVLTDCANNSSSVYLSNALDKIIPSTTTSTSNFLSSGSISFNLRNTDVNDITSDIILACYDSSDCLIDATRLEDKQLTKGSSTTAEFSGLDDISQMSYFKLFFWNDFSGLKPLDNSKLFH